MGKTSEASSGTHVIALPADFRLGSVAEAPPPRQHALPGEVWSAWSPSPSPQADASNPDPGFAHDKS